MIARLLHWITNYLPVREIKGAAGEPYSERYYVGTLAGVCFYLHRFVASDPDRGLHDHPWRLSVSLILSGSYREVRRGVGVRHRKPGRLNIIRGHDFHRVLLAPGAEAWTLFAHGKRVKQWGFLQGGKYIPFTADGDDNPYRDWWLHAPRGRELRAARLPTDLNAAVRRCGEWADATFAPEGDYRGGSIVAHLAREVIELAEDPRDMEEIADCILLLWHLAHQNNGDLHAAVAHKFAINQERTWGTPDAAGVVEHIRCPWCETGGGPCYCGKGNRRASDSRG